MDLNVFDVQEAPRLVLAEERKKHQALGRDAPHLLSTLWNGLTGQVRGQVSQSYLLVKVRGPPGGGDELLKPRLLHPQRGLDVEEHDRTQNIERGSG